MEEFKLHDEEIEKVSGGFRPGDLTEEEQKRYDELNRKAYSLHQGLPDTQQEYEIALKELTDYHSDLLDKVWERRHKSNQ
jgi:hypothetical protein